MVEMPNDDLTLLRAYARNNSEAAFAALVSRYVNLVYSVALRSVRDAHLAEEITQAVFIILARKADSLGDKTILPGWLCRSARYASANALTIQRRRQQREQEAYMQSTLNEAEPTHEETWNQIAPLLDGAMEQLGQKDHDALVLRFFENKTFAEVGATLGASEDAAKMRVNRALEKLRKFFTKRGVSSTTAIIAGAISANSVQAAPAGLAAIISATALSGTTITTAAVLAVTKTIAMTTIQKTIITATLVATVGAGIFEAHQKSQLRRQNQTLQQQQVPLTEQLARLKIEDERLSNLVAQAKDQKSLSEAQFNELLKFRGQAGQAQTAVQQLAKLRTATAQQAAPMTAYLSNVMAQGVAMNEKFKKKAALAKLAHMKQQLHLTDDQEQAISATMMKDIEASSQQALKQTTAAFSGKPPAPEEIQTALQAPANEEADIKALLTPEQLAAYPNFLQAEAGTSADDSAKSDLSMITGEMDLSQEQQDQAHAALYQYHLTNNLPQKVMADYVFTNGGLGDMLSLGMEKKKNALEAKLKILNGILTPEQLQTYQQKQSDMIDMQARALKMFMPQTNNAAAQ
jgi:RNA polymerase sigma factor (sigma-70 family)